MIKAIIFITLMTIVVVIMAPHVFFPEEFFIKFEKFINKIRRRK